MRGSRTGSDNWGRPNSASAERLQLTRATVGKWRIRFLEHRITGLYDEVRPGKPCTIGDERLAQLIHKILHTKPADGSTHWSIRRIAAETAISSTRVYRYFKLLGLYLSPPENALVLCVDEKSQCQALELTIMFVTAQPRCSLH